MSKPWMEVEEPGERDKQLDSVIEILNNDTEWNPSSKESLSSILSKNTTNRIHFQILDAMKKATSDIRISTKIFDNLAQANMIQRLVQFLLEDAVNTSELSVNIMVNLSIYSIGMLGLLIYILDNSFLNRINLVRSTSPFVDQ